MLKFRRVVLFLCGAVSTIGCEDRNDKLIDGGVHDAVPPEVADSANDVREMLPADTQDAMLPEIEDPDPADGNAPPANVSVGTLIPLPLLVSPDSTRPFNHSAETTIASFGNHVAVAMINLHLETAMMLNTLFRSTSVSVSHDRGVTWGNAIRVGAGTQPTDPVLRFGPDGQLWFASWDFSTDGKEGFGGVWLSKTS